VYGLVGTIVARHEIYRDLLSVLLDDTDAMVFISRPEQSGKTFTCTLMAWISNICLGQAGYVLLRSGSQASEDYSKFGESVDDLNRMIWQVMLGYTFDGPNGTGPYRKVPKWYNGRLVTTDLLTDSARVGFMNPFVLHSFDLRHDKTLSSMEARAVLNGRWPLIFSRLCTADNMRRSIVNEMETIVRAYGVDEHGFANVTLLNDEYQMNVKEGTRVQEEMHRPLAQNDLLFRVCAAAIQDENPAMSEIQSQDEMRQRMARWQAAGQSLQMAGAGGPTMIDLTADENDGRTSRWDRSGYSACLKSIVRISATIVSGQVSAEDWDLRKGKVIELKVGKDYYGHTTSTGMDPNHAVCVEWRGGSNLEFLEEGDYPTLPSPPPRLQKFVMDEVFAEFARNGYAHTLLQVLGGNNGALFDTARFLISYADEMVEQLAESRPVIAITAYMYTTAGNFPGGPWLVFSQDALPLRSVIADVAEQMFVEADPKSQAPAPAGKIAMRGGANLAHGIRTLMHQHASMTNALQLPKNSAMFLKNVLGLIDGAVERLAWDKSNIKLVTVGANLLKVGMTPKTPDHKMAVTLALLSASDRQLNNLTGEDVSQGLHGRASGSRDPQRDPYWAVRGDDLPVRLVASGFVKDMLSTYKNVQQYSKQAATNRDAGKTLISAMKDLDFSGFSDLPLDTKLWAACTPAVRRRRGEDTRVKEMIDAVRTNSTLGSLWKRTRTEGFLNPGPEMDSMLSHFEALKEEHPDLWKTSHPPHEMPGWGQTIWVKWRPNFPHYEGTVIHADVVTQGTGAAVLRHTIRFDTDDNGAKLKDGSNKVVMEVVLDHDMAEWSYTQPQPLALMCASTTA